MKMLPRDNYLSFASEERSINELYGDDCTIIIFCQIEVDGIVYNRQVGATYGRLMLEWKPLLSNVSGGYLEDGWHFDPNSICCEDCWLKFQIEDGCYWEHGRKQ